LLAGANFAKLLQQGRNNAPVKNPFFGQNLNNKKIKKIKKKCKFFKKNVSIKYIN